MKQMNNTTLGITLIALVALVTLFNIAQTWNYRELESKLRQAEIDQNLVYEDNKRLLATITELENPERLLGLIDVHPEWQLKQLKPNEIIIIKRERN